jgi:adenylosuccinate synthase
MKTLGNKKMTYTSKKDKNEVSIGSSKRGIGAKKNSRKKKHQNLFKEVLDEMAFNKKRKW